MSVLARTSAFVAAIAAGFAVAVLITSPARAQVGPSSNISAIPKHSQVIVEQLQATPAVSASTAIASIEKVYKFTDANLDPNASAVSALVSLRGDAAKQRIPAWVVTFDVIFPWRTPTARVMYRTWSFVVDAVTGKVEFGYLGTP